MYRLFTAESKLLTSEDTSNCRLVNYTGHTQDWHGILFLFVNTSVSTPFHSVCKDHGPINTEIRFVYI